MFSIPPSSSLLSPLPLQTEKSGVEEICQGKDEVVAAKEQEIAAKQRTLSEAEQQVGSLAEECAALKGKLEGNTEQILSLQVDIETLQVYTGLSVFKTLVIVQIWSVLHLTIASFYKHPLVYNIECNKCRKRLLLSISYFLVSFSDEEVRGDCC